MTNKLPWARQLQKQAGVFAATLADHASKTINSGKDQLKKLDGKHDISAGMKKTGEKISALAEHANAEYEITDKAKKGYQVAIDVAQKANSTAKKLAEQTGMNQAAGAVADAFQEHVVKPAETLIKEHGLDRKIDAIGSDITQAYGDLREVIKPYFPPESAEELLFNTKHELTYISACIMQISTDDAAKVAGQFGKAVASKMTGLAASGAMLTLVHTFGTAGTGTAIASLSGAASTSATFAWIGGLLGGGMVTGAVLTGGLSMVVGLGAYKLLGSERRPFESLSDTEQRIIQTSYLLIAVIDELLADKNRHFDQAIALGLLNNTLLPLQSMLAENANDICTKLDGKNAVAFRHHVLVDYQRIVVNGFKHFISSNDATQSGAFEYLIGGVFYALLSRTAVDGSTESQLILNALRRSDNTLHHATEAQLSDYLSHYSAEQLKGIANNVKGIYHEELWVYRYNQSHTDTYAEMFAETNHLGADIEIKETATHHVIGQFQLKATDSVSYVHHHFERYSDIKVLVTDEAALRMAGEHGVNSSGINNAEITHDVNHDLDVVAHNTTNARILKSAELATAISIGHGVIEMLRGKQEFPQAVIDSVKKIGTASAATAVTAFLFN